MESTMESTMARPGAGTTGGMQWRTDADIDALPWRPVATCPGVQAKELWRDGDAVDSLIGYEPDAATPGAAHPGAHHHIWVVSGTATIAGRLVTGGSYVYVPPGVAHPIRAGDHGCTLLQMHRRVDPAR
jgi:ChrR Cupin-like domain